MILLVNGENEMGSREVPFDKNAICDQCGVKGAYDFMGDFICEECLEKLKIEKEEESHKTQRGGERK
jgi:hypothetical protein